MLVDAVEIVHQLHVAAAERALADDHREDGVLVRVALESHRHRALELLPRNLGDAVCAGAEKFAGVTL
eukprot:7334546-Prymnesium_polylepis.1